jgi:hypothetical protein
MRRPNLFENLLRPIIDRRVHQALVASETDAVFTIGSRASGLTRQASNA